MKLSGIILTRDCNSQITVVTTVSTALDSRWYSLLFHVCCCASLYPIRLVFFWCRDAKHKYFCWIQKFSVCGLRQESAHLQHQSSHTNPSCIIFRFALAKTEIGKKGNCQREMRIQIAGFHRTLWHPCHQSTSDAIFMYLDTIQTSGWASSDAPAKSCKFGISKFRDYLCVR